MLNIRDRSLVEQLATNCQRIDDHIGTFDGSLETLLANDLMRDALSMCVLQICELTTRFYKNFKRENYEIAWPKMKTLRDTILYHYKNFNNELLQNVLENDFPTIKRCCQRTLSETE